MKIKNGEAIHGDCLEEMDKLIEQGIKVDAIITDPSYSLPNNQFRPEARVLQRTFGEFSTYQAFFKIWLEKAKKLVNKEGDIYIFCDETFYAVLYPILYQNFYSTKMIIWDKDRIGMGGIWRRQFEIIIHCRMQPNKTKSGDGDIIKCKPVRDKLHTSQKPIELIQILIKKSTKQGDIVLDTMSGSFTTAVACENTNRKWVCIEIEESYYNIGIQRIQQNNK